MGQKIMVLSFIRKEKSALKVVLYVLQKKKFKKGRIPIAFNFSMRLYWGTSLDGFMEEFE